MEEQTRPGSGPAGGVIGGIEWGIEFLVNRLLGVWPQFRAKRAKWAEIERQLAEKSRLLQTTLDHLGYGIQMVDDSGRTVVINRRAVELLGLPAQGAAHWVEAGAPDHVTCHQQRLADGRMVEVRSIALPGGGLVRIHMDVSQRHEAEARATFLARHDPLTGLANRGLFHERLDDALASGSGAAILLIDLDRFKEVNDTLGHPVGDELLKAVAERLRQCIHDGSTIARLGGDEFAVILARRHRPDSIEALAGRIVEAVGMPYEVEGNQIVVGISVGIAACADSSADRDVLLKQADLALYQAKADGRGIWRCFHPHMAQRLIARRQMESDLRQALADDQLELFYQPFVDLHTGAVTGLEALLRWHHPDRGSLAAGEFIPVAEATGLIIPIGEWVLARACRDAAAWPDPIRLAVNLSAVQFRSPKLVETVSTALAAHGLRAARLELEITESVLMLNCEQTTLALQELCASGVGIALDDFGVGYSSLSYLRSFPFDTIKIDKTFIDGLGQRGDSDAIVRAVIRLARDLNIRSLAEGVENPAQGAILRAEGCCEAQGYLFSRPRPAHEVPAMLRETDRLATACLPDLS